MEMYKYNFSEENKEYLLNFLQTAKAAKSNQFCNLQEYELFSNFLPADINLKSKIKSTHSSSIIDITESDEEIVATDTEHLISLECENVDTNVQLINNSMVDDMLHLIKENLQIEKYVYVEIFDNLNDCDQSKIFCLLAVALNFEEILNFGISLRNTPVCADLVVRNYLRSLLIKTFTLEYSDELQGLLNDFSEKFSDILVEELIQNLLQHGILSKSKVFLQFTDGLSMDFKQACLRKFIITCEEFHEDYIPVLEMLITPQVDCETVNKLIKILPKDDGRFNADKSFGKLLIKVIRVLGKNVATLEKPLKHIIGLHTSIWKSKLQKQFDDCLEESSMLTQSFRY